jgi:hypothetical protein
MVALMRRASVLSATLALCLALPAVATASTAARMTAAFTPLRLGAPTTVSFAFEIAATRSPALLTGIRLAYPPNLGFATSGLGVASCSAAVIQSGGPLACPANSRMGAGTATVQVPFGPFLVKEQVLLFVFAGPSPEGYLRLLISAIGEVPVSARLILSGELRGGHLAVTVPPIPGLPDGPYVALTSLRLTIGGSLTYYEHRRGRTVAYRPPGVGLPTSCPRRGFAFAATFMFLDGSRTGARTAVRCPSRPRASGLAWAVSPRAPDASTKSRHRTF